MNLTIWRSYVLILFTWKIHIHVLWIRSGLVSLHGLIYGDNSVTSAVFAKNIMFCYVSFCSFDFVFGGLELFGWFVFCLFEMRKWGNIFFFCMRKYFCELWVVIEITLFDTTALFMPFSIRVKLHCIIYLRY